MKFCHESSINKHYRSIYNARVPRGLVSVDHIEDKTVHPPFHNKVKAIRTATLTIIKKRSKIVIIAKIQRNDGAAATLLGQLILFFCNHLYIRF